LADANGGCKVNHRMDVGQRPLDDIAVANVADDELGVVIEIVGPIGLSVNLRREHVEDANGVTG
jgi:hypothetical protein